MPVHTAKSLFDKNIRSAETCVAVYDGLAKLDTILNPKWMLRAAVVFAVSALDTYFHDKIKYRVGSFKLDNLPKQLGNLKIRACLKVGGTHDAHTVSSEVIRTES